MNTIGAWENRGGHDFYRSDEEEITKPQIEAILDHGRLSYLQLNKEQVEEIFEVAASDKKRTIISVDCTCVHFSKNKKDRIHEIGKLLTENRLIMVATDEKTGKIITFMSDKLRKGFDDVGIKQLHELERKKKKREKSTLFHDSQRRGLLNRHSSSSHHASAVLSHKLNGDKQKANKKSVDDSALDFSRSDGSLSSKIGEKKSKKRKYKHFSELPNKQTKYHEEEDNYERIDENKDIKKIKKDKKPHLCLKTYKFNRLVSFNDKNYAAIVHALVITEMEEQREQLHKNDSEHDAHSTHDPSILPDEEEEYQQRRKPTLPLTASSKGSAALQRVKERASQVIKKPSQENVEEVKAENDRRAEINSINLERTMHKTLKFKKRKEQWHKEDNKKADISAGELKSNEEKKRYKKYIPNGTSPKKITHNRKVSQKDRETTKQHLPSMIKEKM